MTVALCQLCIVAGYPRGLRAAHMPERVDPDTLCTAHAHSYAVAHNPSWIDEAPEPNRLDPRARCHYCGEAIGLTRDHIVPRALGGPDEPWNIVPACKPCNQAKASRLPTCTCDTCTDALARVHPMARTAARTGGAA